MQNKSVLNFPRVEELRKKKRIFLRIKFILYLFLFFAVFTGLVFLSRIEKINIDQIVVSGNKIIESKEIEDTAKQDLGQKYLWLFPKSNSFIYPEKNIQKDLLAKFKRISSISFDIKNNKILEISVKEREAKYLWCNQECYFLDNAGYIFDTAPDFSDGVYFKFYGNINNDDSGPISSYFLKDNFGRIISLKENFEKMHIKIISFSYEGDDYKINLNSGAEIRFKADADFDKLAENLQAALATEPLHTDLEKKYDSLLYVDLRFGNKVYYKFR